MSLDLKTPSQMIRVVVRLLVLSMLNQILKNISFIEEIRVVEDLFSEEIRVHSTPSPQVSKEQDFF